MKSNILIIGYNRPDKLSELLDFMQANQSHANIYIHIDGPKNADDQVNIEKIQQIVRFAKSKFNSIFEWKFNEFNLGCKLGVISALDWGFSLNESLIILEDDIRPTNKFFDFANEALVRFRSDERVWQINGWSPVRRNSNSYSYLTHHAHIWGWASWRRSFQKYDPELNWFDSQFSIENLDIFGETELQTKFINFWNQNLLKCKNGFDTWDTQWLASMWFNNMYALSPSVSLCGNVGFDNRATHTTRSGGKVFSHIPTDVTSRISAEDMFKLVDSLFYNRIHDSLGYGVGAKTFLKLRMATKGLF